MKDTIYVQLNAKYDKGISVRMFFVKILLKLATFISKTKIEVEIKEVTK